VAGFAADVQACLERIGVLTGRLPLIYTGIAFWDTYLRAIPTNICHLWIANWVNKPDPNMPKDWAAWHFWQYTSDGNGPQYGAQSARIDLNRWNGTLVELHQYAGGGW
jgi:lysozyme